MENAFFYIGKLNQVKRIASQHVAVPTNGGSSGSSDARQSFDRSDSHRGGSMKIDFLSSAITADLFLQALPWNKQRLHDCNKIRVTKIESN